MKIEQILKRAKISRAKSFIEWFINAEPKEIETTDGKKIKCKGLAGLFLFPNGDLNFLYTEENNIIHIFSYEKIKADYTKEQMKQIDVGECTNEAEGTEMTFTCSVCGAHTIDRMNWNKGDFCYCPNCGRKIVEVK